MFDVFYENRSGGGYICKKMKIPTPLPIKLVCRLPSADCRHFYLEEVED
jgi:hypothetical protein